MIIYGIVFLYGIVIGSFLNVCIYRIPLKESVAKERSHCMTCGCQLKWYDLIPVFSWLALKGKCRKCKTPISPQYPIIEGINGLLYVVIIAVCGLSIRGVLYCLMVSALLVLSVIDWRTFEIPLGCNIFLLVLGLVRLGTDWQNWREYVIGFFCISLPLWGLLVVSKGRAIGGGDVKLMAVCGLLLGWKLIVLAFFVGCLVGSMIHLIRMKVSQAERVLAMGPYLSFGIFLAALCGSPLITWYAGILGI